MRQYGTKTSGPKHTCWASLLHLGTAATCRLLLFASFAASSLTFASHPFSSHCTPFEDRELADPLSPVYPGLYELTSMFQKPSFASSMRQQLSVDDGGSSPGL
ncbi:hypothetical protein CMUS01_04789 [Colletotrichum musicola]|uniref:Uncharacterized protein n=1 Tax=Colletotrichum musicola TaxID=2175873 RepID=A0A8H6KW49_9PEZI|nr:hypothetical protein CMUS01_04789 [Colletotrichum musicola]